jgi:hypothetical protein
MDHEVRGRNDFGDMIISPFAEQLASGAQRDEEILRGFFIDCIKQHA